MKRSFCCAVLFVCCSVFFGAAPQARADKIFLKNGKVYEGKIVGKSDLRYLFAVKAGDEEIRLSFFTDEIERVDMEKVTAERQIPYLQDVKKAEFNVGKEQGSYELSLYKKEQKNAFDSTDWYSVDEIEEVMTKEEFAYYRAFNGIANRYAPKFVLIDTMFADLSQATKEDFDLAKGYMRDLCAELDGMAVPPSFLPSHQKYKEAAQATSFVFDALEKGRLEEAARLSQTSQEGRSAAMTLFRQLVQGRQQYAEKAVELPAEAPRFTEGEPLSYPEPGEGK